MFYENREKQRVENIVKPKPEWCIAQDIIKFEKSLLALLAKHNTWSYATTYIKTNT